MLTGTPLDLTSFGVVLKGVGLLISLGIIATVLWLLWLAISRPSTSAKKVIVGSMVLLPIAALFVNSWLQRRALGELPGLFHALCFENAYERINEKAGPVQALTMIPDRGPQGAYEFDLFYGTSRPTEWNHAPVGSNPIAGEGSYEVKHTYLPQLYKLYREEVILHGVKIEIFDRATGRLLADRLNFHWGNDYNRGLHCLGYAWYFDNWAFVERVLGPQDFRFRRAEGHGRVGQEFVRARLSKVENIRTALRGWDAARDSEVLPAGSYNYNDRKITLENASFSMVGGSEPLPIVAWRKVGRANVILMLPNGWRRDTPPTQLMLHFRRPSGEEVANVIALIPSGEQWQSGWGVRPYDLVVKDGYVEIALYGNKVPAEDSPSAYNQGTYLSRYVFEIPLPTGVRALLKENEAGRSEGEAATSSSTGGQKR
jgi:hypothetical protein